MVKAAAVFAFLSVSFSLVCGQATKPASGDAEAVKQLERDWSDAQKAGDADKLGQILADDWEGLGFDGAKSTKKQLLNEKKSGVSKLESFNMGPMDVKIIGNVAVVQGRILRKARLKEKTRAASGCGWTSS